MPGEGVLLDTIAVAVKMIGPQLGSAAGLRYEIHVRFPFSIILPGVLDARRDRFVTP
jgi:hypothetical protein